MATDTVTDRLDPIEITNGLHGVCEAMMRADTRVDANLVDELKRAAKVLAAILVERLEG